MGWKIEALDTCCTAAQVAVDADGIPHVVFNGSGGITYAYRDGTGWHSEVVAVLYGDYLAIAVREDHVNIAWWGSDDNSIYHASKVVGGSWTWGIAQTPATYSGVDNAEPWMINGVQIAIDSSLVEHIIYERECYWGYTEEHGSGYYSTMVHLSGGTETLFSEVVGWESNHSNAEMAPGGHMLAVDSLDVLHVVWTSYTGEPRWDGINYVHYANSGSGWTPEVIASIGGGYPDDSYEAMGLAINSDDDVVVLYNSQTGFYCATVGGSIDHFSTALGSGAIALTNTQVFVAISGDASVQLATRTDSTWKLQTVLSGSSGNLDVAIDPDGKRVHMTFTTTDRPVYATQRNAQAQWMMF